MSKGRIFVTGASSGIGHACALRCAQLGYTVFAGMRRLEDDHSFDALPNVTLVKLDVTEPQSIADTLALLGDAPLAGLINNAGVGVAGPVELVPIGDWRRQFEVNVLGLVAVTQAFLPMLRSGTGRIINIGSIAGRSALPASGPYDASKFAVEAITDCLRMEVRTLGVKVSLIEPGSVATPIWAKTRSELEAIREQAPPHLYAPYAPLMAGVRAEIERSARNAIPIVKVVQAVEHALVAARPKTRYVVGSDARLFLLLNLLPDHWRDWLILSQLKP